jgi:hypothetical protein
MNNNTNELNNKKHELNVIRAKINQINIHFDNSSYLLNGLLNGAYLEKDTEYFGLKDDLEENEIKKINECRKIITNKNNEILDILKTVYNFYIGEEKLICDEIKELERKIINENKKKCNNLHDLYKLVENNYQQDILSKILNDSEYAKIYLSHFTPNIQNNDLIGNDLLGTITVLGTYNPKKDVREEYQIKMYKHSDKGTFWCSCPDHKFNSSKKGTVCKHICFIVCKILKFLDPEFFSTKKLTKEKLEQLVNKLSSKDLAEIDKSFINKIQKISIELFRNFVKQIDNDDSCPICFDDLESKSKVACPMCHNYIHDDCMRVCLEKRDTCLFCMDPIWKEFKKLK